MDIGAGLEKVLTLWRMVLPAMFLGCLFGNWLPETRFWSFFSRRLTPLMRLVALPGQCSLYLAMSFFNLHAANAYLGSSWYTPIHDCFGFDLGPPVSTLTIWAYFCEIIASANLLGLLIYL